MTCVDLFNLRFFVTCVEQINLVDFFERHLASNFQFFVTCVEINKFGRIFQKALARHSGESLQIFSSFVTCVEINQFGRVF